MKTVLFIDPSEKMTAWAIKEEGKLKEFGEFTLENQDESFAKGLSILESHINAILSKHKPDIVACEDIFSQNERSFKVLSKIQGVIELLCYKYNRIQPMFIMASTIRAKYGLNIKTILTEKQFDKELAKKKPKKELLKYSSYSEYLSNPKHYIHKFPNINFNACKKGMYDYNYAKKIVVIRYLDPLGNTFDYKDNNICDAILGANYIDSEADWGE